MRVRVRVKVRVRVRARLTSFMAIEPRVTLETCTSFRTWLGVGVGLGVGLELDQVGDVCRGGGSARISHLVEGLLHLAHHHHHLR